MKADFEQLKACRKNLIKILDSFSLKDLNTIPKNFNNNLIWNVGHCLVTQQLLHYYLSNNELRIDSSWVDKFKKGTVPTEKYDQDLVNNLKELLTSTVYDLVEDYHQGIFQTYKPLETSFGYEIKDIEDAFEYNNMHEAMHIGFCLALKNEI